MKSSHIALGIVTMIAMLLPARAGRGLASGPQASGGSLAPATVLVEPGWQQVNSDGFGDAGATEVTALAVYGSYLYAGTHHATDLALILRSADGVAWNPVIDPGFGNPHDTAPPAILDLTVYGSYLYASTGRGDSAAKIFRTINGVNWAPVVNSGFADQDNVDITALAGYAGRLYAGFTNLVDGVEIWRSFTGDSNSWTRDTPDSLVAAPASVSGFAEFGGALYAAIESDGPAQIWRTFGGGWELAVSDGFDDQFTTLTGGLVVFGGYLYVGAGNTEDGVQLWRSHDGEIWEPAPAPGASDANNEEIDGLAVFDNYLYATVRNGVTGLEVWRSADGALWEQSNGDGFGDGNNTQTNGNNATAAFLSRLFVGTANTASGGELWRLTPASLPAYDFDFSPIADGAGLPGATVTYTLTINNTGSTGDTYDLDVTGNSWATTLSAPSVSANAGASASFNMYVSIPPGAVPTDTDTATVTAVSQGDGSKSATVTLTTSVAPEHGVTLSAGSSLTGPPGTTVAHFITITNSGGTADTFSLVAAGNAWASVVSPGSLALAPGASSSFEVLVTIPANAATGASDSVTVTATSQGDNSVNDSVTLTTTCLLPAGDFQLYLPLIVNSAMSNR